ncbi:hypothetical protein K501DRAFT_335384 [Backusella circina FSU 941]|nr:hypothetical protein K501DRAFT_335384 [Backusella circina FSU 941]
MSAPKKPRVDIEYYEQPKVIAYFENIVNTLRIQLDKANVETSFISAPDLAYFIAHFQKFQLDHLGFDAADKARRHSQPIRPGLPTPLFQVNKKLNTKSPLYHILKAAYTFKSNQGIQDWRFDNPEDTQTYLDMVEEIKTELNDAGFCAIPRIGLDENMDEHKKTKLKGLVDKLGGIFTEDLNEATHIVYNQEQPFDRHHKMWRLVDDDYNNEGKRLVHWLGLPDSYNTVVKTELSKEKQVTVPPNSDHWPWHVKLNWIEDSIKYNEWMSPTDYIAVEKQKLSKRALPVDEPDEEEQVEPEDQEMREAVMASTPNHTKKKQKLPQDPSSQYLPHQQYEVIIPSYAAWFDISTIHPIELKGLPEFFNRRNKTKTPSVYKEYRDFMVNTYRLNPLEYLTVTSCRRNMTVGIDQLSGQQEFKERSSLTRLSVNELSRILEVPLSLLETEQQPNEANVHNEQQPRYWIPTCDNVNLITSQFEDSPSVTHSFANRKRSVVKRRKSVLSHSFTAASEAEAIRMDREAALAALENRLKKEHRKSMDKKSLRRSASLSLPTSTEFGIPDIQNSPILIFGRGPVLRRGAKSKFQRRSSCDTPSEIANYLSNTVENQELPPSPTETTASTATSISSPSSPPLAFTIQVSDYSSSKNNNSKEEEEDLTLMHHQHLLPKEPDSISLSPESAQEEIDQLFPIETNPKKSKLPWSKRIFSKTKKQKSSSVMMINNNEKPDEMISMDEEVRQQHHGKFNLSSLFFRKQNLNTLRKNKSAVNLSTPAKDASPFTSSDTLVSNETKATNNFNNNRLPIHKERAIYKLSHLKLTHPRRPLRDQVMISNLMFWYLSIINQSNNSNLFCENASLARKTYGIPIAGANRRGTRRKNNINNKKNPIKAAIPPRVGSKGQRPNKQRTRYASLGSDESDDSDSSSSDEEDDDGAEKVHKPNHKYRNHTNTRLHHQQKQPYRSATQDSSEEEDDLPLAMYKPKY